MNVNFRYIFEKKGAIAPENILENNLWIDVGNTEKDGAFDHHQDGGFASAFACVMKRTDCYEGIKSYLKADRDKAEVVIHVHEFPDLDCLFSIYAVKRMIQENKANPAEAFDGQIVDVLLDYVDQIDSGRGKHLPKITLYAYFCQIGAGIEDLQKRSREYVDEGLKLLELVVRRLEENVGDVNLFKTPLNEYIDVSTLTYYPDLQKNAEKSHADYQNDKKENRVILKSVKLWNTALGSMQPVKAAIWEKLPSGEDEYNFARDDDDCLLTVYPYKIKEENDPEGVTRVIIALNPNMPEAEAFSLRPLAEIIEQCEQMEEELLYEQTKRYRRDHSQPRKEGGRFDEIPFFETSDPWYFSEKEDIIDSPRADSILPYSRILSIIKNGSSMTKRASMIQYREEDGGIAIEKGENLGEISYGDLYRRTRETIASLKERQGVTHLFAFVKTDPAMLGYSNHWLRTCCLNMVGKSNFAFSKDNMLQMDYRTCLYTDQTITILVAADGRNQLLHGLVNEEKLEVSQICRDLKNILEHRSELRSIGKCLSATIRKLTQESKEIDRFSARLVQLNTRMEEDDLIADPLEQEVYAFIKDVLGIAPLKNSVVTSAQLLLKNAEQMRDRKAAEDRRIQEEREKKENEQEAKRDARIQAGIGLATSFAVFSAWVDAFDFIAKFVPGSDGGWGDVSHCWPVWLLEVAVAIGILVLGCIAAKYVWQAWRDTKDK